MHLATVIYVKNADFEGSSVDGYIIRIIPSKLVGNTGALIIHGEIVGINNMYFRGFGLWFDLNPSNPVGIGYNKMVLLQNFTRLT